MHYTLMSAKNPATEHKKLHELAFNFWFEGWSDFFQMHQPKFKIRVDDFFKQDLVSVLTVDEQPVAVIMHSLYQIGQSYMRQQNYLKNNFTDAYFNKLIERNIDFAISAEMLMVNHTFKRVVPFLYAQVIQLAKSIENVDGILISARNDVGVARLALAAGAEAIDFRQLHGFPVSLIFAETESIHIKYLSEFNQRLAAKMFSTKQNLETISRVNLNRQKLRVVA